MESSLDVYISERSRLPLGILGRSCRLVMARWATPPLIASPTCAFFAKIIGLCTLGARGEKDEGNSGARAPACGTSARRY